MKRYRKTDTDIHCKMYLLGTLTASLYFLLWVIGLWWLSVIMVITIYTIIAFYYTNKKPDISIDIEEDDAYIYVNGSKKISLEKLNKIVDIYKI